jgi:hypothetical protein
MAHSSTRTFAPFVMRPLFIYNSSFHAKQSNMLQPTILKTAYTERKENTFRVSWDN